MKRALVAALTLSFLIPTTADAGLFSRLFGGGRRQVQTVQCNQVAAYQPTYYQQAYYQPQVVAAVPLATVVPYAVDVQAYLYAVNSTAFQSFRDYQNQKAQTESSPPEPPPQAVAQQSEDPRIPGVSVLKANCASCHTAGKAPKSGFAIFDQAGNLASNLPFDEMMERITAQDPSQRMPPKKTLASHDIMSVFRLASTGVSAPSGVKTASNESKIQTPFE